MRNPIPLTRAVWPAILGALALPATAAEVVHEPFAGVRLIDFTRQLPRQIHGYVLDIDLATEGIGFVVTPSNEDKEGETTRQNTLDFLKEHDAQAAINGDFYSTYGPEAGLSGMNASAGDIYSPWHIGEDRPSLNISRDNVATIVQHNLLYNDGVTPTPDVEIYNAVGGNELILRDGEVLSTDTTLAPRTVSGITADNHLLLMVIDGRQSGYSLGVSRQEAAQVLQSFGAVSGINHDGGGSSAMVIAEPTPQAVNRPSDGYLRSVGNNLGVYAAPATAEVDYAVFNDFAQGDEGTFSLSPGYSGSTAGIKASASSAEAVQTDDVARPGRPADGWAQRLTLVDDPAQDGEPETDAGWFVRHISGSSAARSQNLARPTTGFVGFWARTTDADAQIAIALDDANNVTADRGVFRDLIADGQWHLYEWNLADAAQWQGWINGDGVIDTSSFTLDSIQLRGTGDATVDLDLIMHNAHGSLQQLVPEPTAAMILGVSGLALTSRRR